jgi:hypothetical protein
MYYYALVGMSACTQHALCRITLRCKTDLRPAHSSSLLTKQADTQYAFRLCPVRARLSLLDHSLHDGIEDGVEEQVSACPGFDVTSVCDAFQAITVVNAVLYDLGTRTTAAGAPMHPWIDVMALPLTGHLRSPLRR